MLTLIEGIVHCETLPGLLRLMHNYFRGNGFLSCFYFSSPPGEDGLKPEQMMRPLHRGLSPQVVEAYLSANYRNLDIVPRTAMALGRPLRWTEAWAAVETTQAERGFLTTMRELEVGDGFTLPCYGPNGQDGYVGIGKMTAEARTDARSLREMHLCAQAAHLRICEFAQVSKASTKPLSQREREVLGWVARGKSNGVIAEILGISTGTVDTYLRRIYEKLDVSDRTSAAVRGVGMGLITG